MENKPELEINEHILRLSGSANLPQPLEENYTYLIQTEIDIQDINHKNKNNGTKDLIYKGKSTGIIQIIAGKEKIVAVKVSKPSMEMRFSIERYYDEHFSEPGYEFIHPDKEEFYQQTIKKINWNLNNIIRLVYNN